MPFSPQELENKEFVLAFRGYDRDEVRAFLRAAAADYRAALERSLAAERAELESRAPALDRAVSTAEAGRREIAIAGYGAEVEAARIREAAERDAQRMIKEAERKADEVRRAAERMTKDRLDEVTRGTQELRALEERMGRRLYFLETALELARRDLGIDASLSLGVERSEFPISAKQYLPSKAPESG